MSRATTVNNNRGAHMTRRSFTALFIAVGLVTAACSSTSSSGDPSARTCEGGLGSCGVEVGPPVTRYCVMTKGACNSGHPIGPDDVGGHLFAGVTVSGHASTGDE